MIDYTKIAPDDSFIGRYLAHMNNTETATDYDFWTALWLLSCACGRNIIVDRPLAPVFLNLYVVLVAESGVTRKSSSVRSASSMARSLLHTTNSTIGLIESRCTPEFIDKLLTDNTTEHGCGQLAIAISELAVFLGSERYTKAMPVLLTDLYDCPATRRGGGGVGSGTSTQRDVFVNFLAASTPAWLFRYINPEVVSGGFTSRCMFVVSDKPKRRIAWPTPRATLTDPTSELLDMLTLVHRRAAVHGSITLNPSARELFKSWYDKRQLSHDEFRGSFESREDAHVLRLAAFLCINDNSWTVQHHHLRRAIDIVAHVKETSARLFNSNDTKGKFATATEIIRGVLLQAGMEPIQRSKLYLRVRQHVDTVEFAALMDVMHEMGVIQKFEMRFTNGGKPVELIRGTRLLIGRNTYETILERIAS